MQLHSNTQHQHFTKAQVSDHKRLDALLTAQEKRIRNAFIMFVRNTRSPQVMAPVKQLLKGNNIQAATGIVDQHITAFARVLPQAFVDVASRETPALAAKAGVITKAAPVYQGNISISFDPSNPNAARLMQSAQLKFIQDISNQQRAAIRSALAQAYGEGDDTYYNAFVDSIGLTPYQTQVVDNYRTLLENGSTDALARDLRSRRYDNSVQAKFDAGEPLSDSQIDNMVTAYRNNMLNMRADTIARTEGLSVVSQARREALDQTIDQAGIDRSSVTRTWNATQDSRTRDSHMAMDGQTVGLDEPYEAPSGEEIEYPGDPHASAGERINCRCTETFNFND